MRWAVRILAALAVLTAGIGNAEAPAQKLALVIGVSDYARKLTPEEQATGFVVPKRLPNAVRDAMLVGDALEAQGFTVMRLTDPDKRAMLAALISLSSAITRAGPDAVGVFYFAGHGAQGRPALERDIDNYLIPRNTALITEVDLESEALALSRVSATLQPAARGAMVLILDACRDFALPAANRSGAVTRGLAEARAAPGTMIAYATSPGSTALDGPAGGNGPYARALAAELRDARGETLEQVFIAVRNRVLAETRETQLPWENSSLRRSVTLGVTPVSMLRDVERELAETRRQVEAERVAALSRRQAAEREELLAAETRRQREQEFQLRQAEAQAAAEELRQAQKDAVAYQAQRRAEVDAEAARTRGAALDAEVERRRLAAEAAQRRLDAATRVPVVPVVSTVRPYGGPIASPPGSSFQECAECPEMVVLPAGRFMMGSPRDEEHRFRAEGPQHMVSIAAFAAGRFEVTFAEWDACAAAEGCRSNPRPADQGWGRGRRPAINVSWNDAQEYVAWVNSRSGRGGYRLLSEAEWEYIARAGSATVYPWGNDPNGGCAHENHADMSARREHRDWATSTCDDGTGDRTAEVGRYRANAYGLHDVNGNVREMVADCLRTALLSTYENAPTDGSAVNLANCSIRMSRGGAYNVIPKFLRSALRTQGPPDNRRSYLGFRVAKSLQSSGQSP